MSCRYRDSINTLLMISIFFKKADRYHLFFLSLSLSALLFGLAFFLFVFFCCFFFLNPEPVRASWSDLRKWRRQKRTTRKKTNKKQPRFHQTETINDRNRRRSSFVFKVGTRTIYSSIWHKLGLTRNNPVPAR